MRKALCYICFKYHISRKRPMTPKMYYNPIICEAECTVDNLLVCSDSPSGLLHFFKSANGLNLFLYFWCSTLYICA